MKRIPFAWDIWGTAIGALALRGVAMYSAFVPPFDPTIFTFAILISFLLYIRLCFLLTDAGPALRRQILHAGLRAIVLESISALCAPGAPFDNAVAYWGLGILSFAFCVQLCSFLCLEKGFKRRWRFLGLFGLFGAVILAVRSPKGVPEKTGA